jgi:hypothetical protein
MSSQKRKSNALGKRQKDAVSVVESICPGVIKVEDLDGEHGRLIMEVGPLRSFYVPVSRRTVISTVGTMAIITT